MEKITSKDIVKGFPNIKIEGGKIYGEFQIGKQTKMSHKILQNHSSSKVLKLLHMNFIETIQVRGLGGINNTLYVKNDTGKLTYDFVFSKIPNKMLEHYVQLRQSEVEKSISG